MNRSRKTKEILICVLMTTGVILAVGRDAKGDFIFGPPEILGPMINSSQYESFPKISDDGLSLWFARQANWDETDEWWLSTRAAQDAPWEAPVNHGEWSKAHWDFFDIERGLTTPDGLELYFSREVTPENGGLGGYDLWMLKRDSISDDWGPRVNLGPTVNSAHDEWGIFLSPDGLELYFCDDGDSPRPGGSGSVDLWVMRRASIGAPWTEPENLGPAVNSTGWDSAPCLSQDGLVLFFDSIRPGGYGSYDLYMARRASLSDPWGESVNLGPVINSPLFFGDPHLSSDGSTLFWWGAGSRRFGGHGGYDIWQASVQPIADFSGDGMVDATDLSIMEAHWGEDYPLCDIGPMPWGDGVVNEADKELVMAYWGQAVDDPRLVSHWKLDETEGSLAYDSRGENHGKVHGAAIWQPSAGQFGGALQFDGIDDYVETGFVHDPTKGPFNVCAWIKGGAPGEAIISQADTYITLPVETITVPGSVWLGADPIHGRLMTGLMQQYFPPLESESVITDGQWHFVSLAYDSSKFKRHLYVDGIEVAKDTDVVGGVSSDAGLYIGAGPALKEGTFWSGLIDDVRFTDPSGPHPPEVKQDREGFQIYWDDIALNTFYTSSISQGNLDYFDQTNPVEGSYCIYCTGLARYNHIGFNFWPDRDLTLLVQEGYALEFWVRGDSPGTSFDVRFVDSKTDDPVDHPWRMRKTINESLATWDGQWQLVRIPLSDFTEHGSWDDGSWFNPQGNFDWSAVDRFEIVAEHHDFEGIQFWFDDIQITE